MSNENTTPVASETFTNNTLDRLAALESQAADQSQAGGAVSSDPGTCTVTAIRAGKNGDRHLEVAGGTSIGDLMRQLGWSTDGCTFKKKTDRGAMIECSASTLLDAGSEHTIVCSPRVVGG